MGSADLEPSRTAPRRCAPSPARERAAGFGLLRRCLHSPPSTLRWTLTKNTGTSSGIGDDDGDHAAHHTGARSACCGWRQPAPVSSPSAATHTADEEREPMKSSGSGRTETTPPTVAARWHLAPARTRSPGELDDQDRVASKQRPMEGDRTDSEIDVIGTRPTAALSPPLPRANAERSPAGPPASRAGWSSSRSAQPSNKDHHQPRTSAERERHATESRTSLSGGFGSPLAARRASGAARPASRSISAIASLR